MPHPYLANTSGRLEKRINKANVRAGSASGMPGYQHKDQQRQDLIRKAESKRPLRRSEFINLYGYQAWLDYCQKNDLDPKVQKWADAHMHKLSSIGGPEAEL
jgi:hypothetical protein